jgi:haloalkane dehalogenase
MMSKSHILKVALLIGVVLSLAGGVLAQDNTGDCPDNWERFFEPDPELYPFESNCFVHELGVLHYVDEGDEDSENTILFVHGNPSWSILHHSPMQAMIEAGHRVISLDNFGFGLSDKPSPDDFGYTPRDHSDVLEQLVIALDLQNITIVVHDWGGPIGLGMAGRQADRIANIVITNTWAWDVSEEDPTGVYHSLINWGNTSIAMGEALGDTCLMPRTTAQGTALAYDNEQGELYDRVLATYRAPWFAPETGEPYVEWACDPTAIMAQSILGDPEYLQEVEDGLANLIGKPFAMVIGRADPLFGELHAIEGTERRCPDNTVLVCDAEMLSSLASCSDSLPMMTGELSSNLASIPASMMDNFALMAERSNQEAYVCRIDNEPVLPYVDRFVELLGDNNLVSLYTLTYPRHFIANYPEGNAAIVDALDDLLQNE